MSNRSVLPRRVATSTAVPQVNSLWSLGYLDVYECTRLVPTGVVWRFANNTVDGWDGLERAEERRARTSDCEISRN